MPRPVVRVGAQTRYPLPQRQREKGNRSRGASSAPEACSPRCHEAKSYEALPPAKKREAERRKAHCPINVRVKRGCALLSWRRAAFRRSRLRHSPPGSTPMAQLQNRVSRGLTDGCFARFAKLPRLSTLRADRSLCRSTGDPKPPGCGAASSARGHRRSLWSLRHAFRKGALSERDSLFVSELETKCQ